MLTIFSIPKPFRGEAERLQMNAVQSWRASNPAARIVLCGLPCESHLQQASAGLLAWPSSIEIDAGRRVQEGQQGAEEPRIEALDD